MSVARLSEVGLFDDVERDVLSVWCIAKDIFEDEALLDLVRDTRSPSEFCIVRIANRHLSILPLYGPPQYQLVVVRMFFSQYKPLILTKHSLIRAAINFMWCIFSKFLNSSVAKKIIV